MKEKKIVSLDTTEVTGFKCSFEGLNLISTPCRGRAIVKGCVFEVVVSKGSTWQKVIHNTTEEMSFCDLILGGWKNFFIFSIVPSVQSQFWWVQFSFIDSVYKNQGSGEDNWRSNDGIEKMQNIGHVSYWVHIHRVKTVLLIEGAVSELDEFLVW